jgi:hypothetical protein
MFDATPLPDRVDDLSLFGWPDVRARNPSDKDLQRAEGSGRIVLSGSDKGTRIMDVFQRSPSATSAAKPWVASVKTAGEAIVTVKFKELT